MKVLFITNFPSPYRVDFFNRLGERCDLTVAYEREKALHRDSKWKGTAAKNYNEIYLKLKPKGTSHSKGNAVKKLVSRREYDTVVFCGYASPSVRKAMIYCRIRGIKYYVEFDGCFDRKESFAKAFVKRFLLKKAAGFFITGKETAKYLRHIGLPDSKMFVYPFSSVSEKDIIDAPISPDDKARMKKSLGLPDKRIIISVGQFIHRKGFDVLLRSLKSTDDAFFAVIVGGEPTEEYLQLVDKLGLKNVKFMPFLPKDELFELYKACDVFVFPTREDIWGLVVNEAMACGLPVISTDRCIAGLELVKDGCNGFTVAAENADALSAAINKTLSVNAEQMSQNCILTAKEYTIEKMVSKHIEVFSGKEK